MKQNMFLVGIAMSMMSVSAYSQDVTAYSQNVAGAIAAREARTEGKLLTMEEAVTSSMLKPETREYKWRSDDCVTYYDNKRGLVSVVADMKSLKENAKENKKGNVEGNVEKSILLSVEKMESLVGGNAFADWFWADAGTLVVRTDAKIYCIDVERQKTERVVSVPEGSGNYTYNPYGCHPFTRGGSLFYAGDSGEEHPVAVSDDPDIVYGDVVSRNEFGISGGIFLSPDGSKMAFYRKDESKVGTFPLLDITTRTGSLREIKYPMAGMDSENISLGIFDFASGSVVYADVDDFDAERYLTNVCWSADGTNVFIQVLSRDQKHLRLNMYDGATGRFVKTVLSEDEEKYVEPLDPLYYIKGDSRFVYRTNVRDGYRNLYLCDTDGNAERLTNVDADVEYIGNDGKYVFYMSSEVSPVEKHLFAVCLKDRKVTRLTTEAGVHTVSLSPDCKAFLDSYSSIDVPGRTDLAVLGGRFPKVAGRCRLLEAADPVADYAFGEIVLGKIKSADGKYDNYYRLIRPHDFDPSEKYPVIVYVYGGPHSQMVDNSWLAKLRRWEMLMAQKGYIVYVQDNRGTLYQGEAYEKAIWGQCGQAEMADQMEGVEMLKSLPYVDADRIGIHGWSYGGFMTISLMVNYPDVFKAGVAGGPVIDWKWYEVMYGERYMGYPGENPEGYEKTSLISKAADLKGRLLICQGAVDNVVVWQHSLSFVRECIKNGVQVDYFPYPCAEHNVMGRDRIHLMDKVTLYFDRILR